MARCEPRFYNRGFDRYPTKCMWEIGMIPKISLAAAFVWMMAPPMACGFESRRSELRVITRQVYQSPPSMVSRRTAPPVWALPTTTTDNSSDNDNGFSTARTTIRTLTAIRRIKTAPVRISDDSADVLGAPDEEQSEPRQAPR